jgi:hypothetical protein
MMSSAQSMLARLAVAALASATISLLTGCADRGAAPNRASASAGGQPRFHCALTRPNGLAPPGEGGRPSDFGSGGLWTELPLDGVLAISASRPRAPGTVFGEVHRDGSLTTKFPWWGAKRAGRTLVVTGRRLDAYAKPLRTRIEPGFTSAPHFWASRITFSAPGCWAVTAAAGRETLSFVVEVRRG